MKQICAMLTMILVLLSAGSCNKAGESAKKEAPRAIETYKVECTQIQTYIEATGSIQPDLEGTARIVPHLPGVVSRIFVKVGDRVKKGDPLVAIKSPEVTDTYSSHLSTLAQLKQAERIYNLNMQLFEIGAVTRNDLLNSEANYQQLSAVSEGLKSKLDIYGYSIDHQTLAGSRSDTITVRATMSGFIADIQSHTGDKVDTATPLMTVADPQSIVVVANIYDTDIMKVKKGSNVTFYVDVFPDTPFKGLIHYVSDLSDTESKTVKTFISILGRRDFFKHNMFLKLRIEGERKLLPLIPQSAIVYKDGRFYVYLADTGAKQNLKEIKPVREVSGKFMAVEGVKEGEKIVLTAIDLEKP